MGLSQCSDCGLDFQSLLKAAALCVCQFEMSGDKADKAIAVYVHSKTCYVSGWYGMGWLMGSYF